MTAARFIPTWSRKRYPLLPLFLLLFSVLVFHPVLSTGGQESSDKRTAAKKDVKQKIIKSQINIQDLRQGIKQHKDQIAKTQEEETDLLAELEEIDSRLQIELDKLVKLQQKMSSQKELIRLQKQKLKSARKDKEDVRHHLEKRIKAYYKTGPIGIMNVAFSSETLPELLRFHDSFQSLLAYDNQVIKNYRGVINDLQMGNKMLFWEKGVMDGFIRQTITDKDAIFEIRQEKEKLLSQIRSRKQLHERAIKEMEKATDSMLANLNVLQKKDELLGKGFLLAKGTLPWPALGPVVTRFGEKKTNMLGITKKSTGISIQAPNGSPIRAVFEGKILYSSYLRGYGNTIIIDHGDNHYSIVSRLERLLKKKGRQVSQSEIIGFSGTTGALFDDGIHFEIRRGKQVQNPLAWLEKNSH